MKSSKTISTINSKNNYQYQSTLTRRESLKWLGVLSASAVLPSLSGCEPLNNGSVSKGAETVKAAKGHWPNLTLSPILAKGYGKDPDLIIPPKSPWPKTLTTEQLTLVAVLADIIVPRDGDVPSASEVNVPDVIDEWVSAPYKRQQSDRNTIMHGITWIDDESKLRFQQPFIEISKTEQLAIIDDIAYQNETLAKEFQQPTNAFSNLRKLILAAFFCTPEGTKDLGYQGNVAIAGDYPGPSDEAMVHLNVVLDKLGLTL
ncbi:MAG: gluconate 2-dehydrogenase subunit 3 family protein [Thalassotalea sp.]|nr:gluconate 2-dehydrogenase subunit 3 family protein [Thalassotalea sp.]